MFVTSCITSHIISIHPSTPPLFLHPSLSLSFSLPPSSFLLVVPFSSSVSCVVINSVFVTSYFIIYTLPFLQFSFLHIILYPSFCVYFHVLLHSHSSFRSHSFLPFSLVNFLLSSILSSLSLTTPYIFLFTSPRVYPFLLSLTDGWGDK